MTPEQLKLIRDTLEQVQSIIESTYGHDENEDGTNGARNDECSDYSSSDIVEFLCEIEKAVDDSLAVLQSIQTPPVPENPASGREWRIVWEHKYGSMRFGAVYVFAVTEDSAKEQATTLIERTEQLHRTKFLIRSCSINRAILTNGETDETFRPQEND